MKNFRIFFILVIGIAAIDAVPTPKPLPEQPENKPLVAETKLANKGSPEIAVENAEEPKKGDRSKKSASTTFCVEIRPGASDPPHKYCDPPIPQSDDKPPPQHDEVHEQPPAAVQNIETEVPVYVIPPSDVAIYDSYLQPIQPSISYIQPQQPSIPCLPQQPGIPYPIQPQFPPTSIIPGIDQIQPILVPQLTPGYPYRPPPCLSPYPWSSSYGVPSLHRPHTQISLFRSADGTPLEDSASSPSKSMMEMKSVEDDKRGPMESSSLPNEGIDAEKMPMGPDVGDPKGRSFLHKFGGIHQASPSAGCQGNTQIVIPQYRPQTGCGSPIIFPYGRQNDQGLDEGSFRMKTIDPIGSVAMSEFGTNMNIGQAKTHMHPTMIAPMISPLGHFGYHSNPMIYHPLSGYQGRLEPYKPFSITSGHPLYRKDQYIRRQAEQKDQEPTDNQMEQKVSQPASPMTPSQMLNKMRDLESQRTSPMMQSFSRDEDRRNEEGNHINIHIPSGGQPLVRGGVMRNADEKNLEIPKRDEMSKTEDEGPTTDSQKA